MKRFLYMTALIIVCYLLQTTVMQKLALANIVPNLILIIVVAIGYMRGKVEAMFIGLLLGLLVDCQYNSLIGVCGLIYMLVGYLVGLCNKIYYRDDYTIPILLVGLSDIFYNFVYYILTFLLRNRTNLPYYFLKIMLPELVYTVLVSILLYKLIHSVITRLERKSGKETI